MKRINERNFKQLQSKSQSKKSPQEHSKPKNSIPHHINPKSEYSKYINPNPRIITILVLGESKSGKTNLVNRLAYNTFTDQYIPTTEIRLVRLVNHYINDKIYHIELIDTPCLEKYLPYVDEQLAKVSVVLFVFDASNKGALQRIKETILKFTFYENQKWGVIATKKDLAREYKKYRFFEIDEFCKLFGTIAGWVSVVDNAKGINKYFSELFPTIHPVVDINN